MASLKQLNEASPEQAEADFLLCCGCRRWAKAMVSARPFADAPHLFDAAQTAWRKLAAEDWLEAFGRHPRIGDKKILAAETADLKRWAVPQAGGAASGSNWAEEEQAGVHSGAEDVLDALARGNRDYESRFGYIFIVCAAGKSAEELLAILQNRLKNDPEAELHIAAGEQSKITRLRLEKLLNP